MSVDILGTGWDQCRSTVQYSFTSTETRRLVRTDSPGRPPRLSHSSWTMKFVVEVTVGLYKFYNRHTLYGQIRVDRDREIWRTELNPVIRLTNPTTQLQSSGAPGFSVGRSSNRAIPPCPFAERVRTACRWEHNQLQQKTAADWQRFRYVSDTIYTPYQYCAAENNQP